MTNEGLFGTDENRALIAICTRKLISNIGIGGIIWGVINIAIANIYRKLGHLREQIASVDPEKIKATKLMCKTLLKKKLKAEPSIVQTADRKCRAQLMEGAAFFIQRDMMRAFIATKEDVRNAIVKADAKSLKLHFDHPVGKLKYQLDKKNSEKVNDWFAMGASLTTGS
jgi:hypothetical protein